MTGKRLAQPPFTTRPELRGTFGAIASTHWLASAAGMAVLERGGNACDAAVAAGFTLQVVEPHLNGPGGDMPAMVYDADRDKVVVVCGQGPAPQCATIERFHQFGLDMVPGNGLLPACVPGGGVPAPGSRFRNPALAATYRRLVSEAEAASGDRDEQIEAARRAWYEGFVAEAIDSHLRTAELLDITGRHNPGLLRADDMAAWRPTLEGPVSVDYGEWRVFKTGPWGQGPVFLQQLALLRGFDMRGAGPGSADFIHTVVECAKLAYADREAWYGDPGFAPDLTGELLDSDYNEERRRLVGGAASLELRPGSPGGRWPRVPRSGEPPSDGDRAGLGDPTVGALGAGRGDTCHLDVVDRWGNMVSATPSGGWLQSSPAIPGLGFCLGTRAQIFNLEEGHPNALVPGKRPRTTLSPSLAFRDAEPFLAFGTPGADQQDQWSLTFFVTVANSDWDLQRAIDAPMFHTDHFPRSFYPHHAYPGTLVVEDRLSEDAMRELRRRGHEVQVVPGWSLGRLSAVANDRRAGWLRAAANPRFMQGYAVGR